MAEYILKKGIGYIKLNSPPLNTLGSVVRYFRFPDYSMNDVNIFVLQTRNYEIT